MSDGILFVAIGEHHYREAGQSLARIRSIWPGVEVTLNTYAPDGEVQLQRIRAMRNSPYDFTLYLDTDTWLLQPVPELFELLDRFDVALAHAPWRERYPVDVPVCFPEFNSGVMAYRNIDEFFALWEAKFLQDYASREPGAGSGFFPSQPAMREALWLSNLRIATLPPEYNWRGDGYAQGPIKIIHSRKLRVLRDEANLHVEPRACIEGRWYYYRQRKEATMKAIELTGEAYHHTEGDVDTLHRLAAMLPPNPVIVNIGACFGTSTLAMLEARPDAFIFSIDINVCPKEPEHLGLAGVEARRVVRCLGKSQEIGRYWPERSADLVFVDGGHAYQGVLADIFAWTKTVKPGGLIAFHDYGQESLPGVRQAVDEVFGDVEPLLFVERIKAYQL